MLKIKRVYESKQDEDGTRLLVDRLWPRGLSKAGAGIDEWMKDVGPSDELRKWFGHDSDRWAGFRLTYLKELAGADKEDALKRIARMSKTRDVTLLYAAKDTAHNNAIVLAEALADMIS